MRKIRILLLLLFLILATGVFVFAKEKTRTSVSPLQNDAYTKVLGIFSVRKDPDTLKKQLQSSVGNTLKNYSVYVVDYHSNFSMGINESEIFTAASVNKLPIMAALYNEVQNGNVNFDRVITLQPEDIQDYGTGSIRYDPPGTTYTVKTLVRLMMQKSDNTAAFLLGNYVIGLPTVQSVINSWGLTQTDIVNNKTSNKDMELLLRKMYGNNVTNPALTAEMLGFTRDSDFENRIPGELPPDVTVYHKIGNVDNGEVHDVGIVIHENTIYYIGILTSNAGDPEAASILEAKISKIVYDFMR
ncbi:MAG: class A beta-lactamase-related serine hydrolase [Candidatus Gottesmanbacteria bacterium]|nr:class A beta-lactamase-related serine hydrolase [Candidatus Gottesmanbacteria bacterium]